MLDKPRSAPFSCDQKQEVIQNLYDRGYSKINSAEDAYYKAEDGVFQVVTSFDRTTRQAYCYLERIADNPEGIE